LQRRKKGKERTASYLGLLTLRAGLIKAPSVRRPTQSRRDRGPIDEWSPKQATLFQKITNAANREVAKGGWHAGEHNWASSSRR